VSTSSTTDNYTSPWVASPIFPTAKEAAVEIARVFQQQVSQRAALRQLVAPNSKAGLASEYTQRRVSPRPLS
jgi:hypothetical protein